MEEWLGSVGAMEWEAHTLLYTDGGISTPESRPAACSADTKITVSCKRVATCGARGGVLVDTIAKGRFLGPKCVAEELESGAMMRNWEFNGAWPGRLVIPMTNLGYQFRDIVLHYGSVVKTRWRYCLSASTEIMIAVKLFDVDTARTPALCARKYG